MVHRTYKFELSICALCEVHNTYDADCQVDRDGAARAHYCRKIFDLRRRKGERGTVSRPTLLIYYVCAICHHLLVKILYLIIAVQCRIHLRGGDYVNKVSFMYKQVLKDNCLTPNACTITE